MKLKVRRISDRANDLVECIDEKGDIIHIDLIVSGDLGEGITHEDLIGETIEVGDMTPYTAIGHFVSLSK